MQEPLEADSASGIVIKDVVKTFKAGKVKALDELSLSARPGEALGIIGPNGAGKTTLFGCLLAFLQMDKGSILINGLPPDALEVRRTIGYLPERLNFDKWMTGRQFMQFHYELSGQAVKTKAATCDELLAKVGLDERAWDLLIKRYSRGMLQRLGFAQALIGQPKYLLLDEPASGVDPAGVLLLRKLMRELKAAGMTIILNSHQLEQVEKLCDRVAFINKGRVDGFEDLKQGPTETCRYIIKWVPSDGEFDSEQLSSLALKAGAELIEAQPNLAVFNVAYPDIIAETIKAMVLQGFRIIHVSPQDNRLERFFMDDHTSKT
jgi:ABC-2 type transport system ATP-binding protein